MQRISQLTMKTLVILGNGFDLDLSWKTSYSNFFNSYWGSCTKQWIPDLQDKNNWYDLEGYLRQRATVLTMEGIDKLWYDWLKCKSNIWEYFRRGKENGIFETNTNSCAFSLLSKLSNTVVYSFNYTEPNYYIDGLPKIVINHIHGALWDGLTGSEIRLGIDSSVECNFKNAAKMKPLLKSVDNKWTYNFLKSMKEASSIIVFGHSFGVTDSDYFKPILDRMVTNNYKGKTMYIVTNNNDSMNEIKNNMSSYGINYNHLILSDNDIREIYTVNGIEDNSFQKMLSII